MSEIVYVGSNAMDVRESDEPQIYSKVILHVNDEITYIADGSDDSGSTFEATNPFGTQQMANDILEKLKGIKYQPFSVTNGLIDPSAELGDIIETNGVYGGLYVQDTYFGHQYSSDYGAPQDEQLDHEYTYESPIERRITRESTKTRAEFRITNELIAQEAERREADGEEFRATFATQATEIGAKVSQRGGTNSSFGWTLLSNGFTLYSSNKTVFTCNSSGINVDGSITARSGYIGDGTNGFTITSTYFHNGKNGFNDFTNAQGVYVGTNGIALGRNGSTPDVYENMFSVDRSGKLTAQNATIAGTITAKSGRIGAGSDGRGGFLLTANKFYTDGKSSYNSATDGVYIGTDGIGLGSKKFYVSADGKMTASDATITGAITATSGTFTGKIVANGDSTFKGKLDGTTGDFSGKIIAKEGIIGASSSGTGGFTIKANKLYTGQTTYGGTASDDVAGVYVGTDGIGLGKGNFYVTKVGKLTAKDVNLSGTITATSGRIGATYNDSTQKWEGGFYYTANKMYSDGKGSYNGSTEGVYIGTDGIGLGNKAFYVTKAGALTATSATITGKITANGGSTFKGKLSAATGDFKGTLSGVTGDFSGKIIAKEGIIGANSSGTGGLTIKANKLYVGQSTYNGTATDDVAGVYVGTDGIGVGKGKFFVTKAGALTAKSGTIGSDDTDSNRWQIGGKSIYKGANSLTSTTQGVYLGTDGIRLYKDDRNSFTFKQGGTFTVCGGMNGINDETATSGNGLFMGNDGIALGGGKFKVTKAGEATLRGTIYAKEGRIGDSWNSSTKTWNGDGFIIKNKKMYHGTDSLTSTTAGVYVGEDGLRLYKDARNSFTFKQNGTFTVCGGMSGISDETATSGNGLFIGNDGIALGGGKFKVTKNGTATVSGTITASSGSIGGWTIGSSAIYSGKGSNSSYPYSGMSSGKYSFYAGSKGTSDSDIGSAYFSVTNDGKVTLYQLYYWGVTNIGQAGYDETNTSTWQWQKMSFDFYNNAYKIAGNNATIASVNSSTGRVTLSNGRSFNTAASVSARGEWSGTTFTASPKVKNSSGDWVASGGSSTSTTISAQWDYPYAGASYRNIYKVSATNPNGSPVQVLKSTELSVTKTYNSTYHNYTIEVMSGSTKVFGTSTDSTAYTEGFSSAKLSGSWGTGNNSNVWTVSKGTSGSSSPISMTITAGVSAQSYNSSTHKYTAFGYAYGNNVQKASSGGSVSGTEAYDDGYDNGWYDFYNAGSSKWSGWWTGNGTHGSVSGKHYVTCPADTPSGGWVCAYCYEDEASSHGYKLSNTYISMTKVNRVYRTSTGVEGDYGTLYYKDGNNYVAVTNDSKYWYYSNSSKAGTTAFYY